MSNAVAHRLTEAPDHVIGRKAQKGALLTWCEHQGIRPSLMQIEQERARRTNRPVNNPTERNHR